MILTVTLNPCIDKTLFIADNTVGGKIKAENVRIIAGGKGNNVARVLKNFGYEVKALSFLGGYIGEKVKDLLETENINTIPIWTKNATREVITVVEKNNYRQTVFFEPSPEIKQEEIRHMVKEYEKHVVNSRIVILGGSSPCLETDDLYFHLINIAKKNEIPVFLDSSRDSLRKGIKAIPYLVKPNITEAKDIWNKPMNQLKDWLDFLNFMSKKGIFLPVLSMGKDGAMVLYNNEAYKINTPDLKVVNNVGSGDSMIAGIAAGLMENINPLEAVKLGVAAGTVNSVVWDAGGITKDEVYKLYNSLKAEAINTLEE